MNLFIFTCLLFWATFASALSCCANHVPGEITGRKKALFIFTVLPALYINWTVAYLFGKQSILDKLVSFNRWFKR